MNNDVLHDALNELDDALIEEVEALRGEPRVVHRRWVRPVAIAACFCVIATALLVINVYDLWKLPDASTTQDGDDIAGVIDGTADRTGVTEIQKDGDSSTTIQAAGNSSRTTTTAASINIVERPSVKVRIDKWNEHGFVGVVTEIVDTELYDVGSEVTVRFLDRIGFEEVESEIATYHFRVPTEDDLPSGSEVTVRFAGNLTTDQVESDGLVLYAEAISVER